MDPHLLSFDICSRYNIVQKVYTQSRRLIHIFPFIHTSGLFEYVCRHIHSGTVLLILALYWPFSSTVIDNAQYWWRHLQPSLYCPTQGPWACSCSTHKTARPTHSASLHPPIWNLYVNVFSPTISSFSITWFYAYCKVTLTLSNSKISKYRKKTFKVEK